MSSSLTPGDGQDLLARVKGAWESRDPDRALGLFSPDAEARHDPFGAPLRGSNEIRGYWNVFATDHAHVEFDAERVWVTGRTVLASFHATYTLQSSAERRRERGFLTMEMDDEGLVARLRQWSVTRTVGVDGSLEREWPTSLRGEGGDE